ncbi:MAG: alpha/beta fold hydrolase [Syntrophobacteraceae bacterium]|nr:alpha/beta hydrolase [Desulfobacteraceae bacterium]
MPTLLCETAEIYYEVHGQGAPLLLISGLGGGTWSWYGQIPYFRNYYRAIVFDNRGAGRSSMPPGPYRMDRFAHDALCLLDHLEVEKAFVLGLSMGGMIAQELTLLAPERVRALVLGCTHCGGEAQVPPDPEVVRKLLDNDGLDHEGIIEKNLPLFLSRECIENRPEVARAYRAAQLAAPPQPDFAFKAQLAAVSGFDASTRLHQIGVPVMIVAGSHDVLIPRENAYILAGAMPGAQLAILPGAGHALHAECADTLNSIADNFFQQFIPEDES